LGKDLFAKHLNRLHKKLYELERKKQLPPKYSFALKDLIADYKVPLVTRLAAESAQRPSINTSSFVDKPIGEAVSIELRHSGMSL